MKKVRKLISVRLSRLNQCSPIADQTKPGSGVSAPPPGSAQYGFPRQAPPPYSQFGPGPAMAPGHPPMYYAPQGIHPGQMMMPPGAMYPNGQMPPPPYDPSKPNSQQQVPPHMNAYPYGPMPGQQYAFYPGYVQGHPAPMYPGYPMIHAAPLPPHMAVVMPDGFDPSARFDGIARPSIPVRYSLLYLILKLKSGFYFIPYSPHHPEWRPIWPR